MIRWKLDRSWIPVGVECKKRGWPNLDADGSLQFEITHFDTEADAWRRAIQQCDAMVSVATRKAARSADRPQDTDQIRRDKDGVVDASNHRRAVIRVMEKRRAECPAAVESAP